MNVRLGVRYMSLNIEVSLITAESAENAEQLKTTSLPQGLRALWRTPHGHG